MYTIAMEDIRKLQDDFVSTITSASNSKTLEELRIKYLGRNGEVNKLMEKLPTLPKEERGNFGKEVNALKKSIEGALFAQDKKVSGAEISKLSEEKLDVTIPGIKPTLGHIHPVTQAMDEILQAFTELGYEIMEGPDVENDHYNFEVLNIPKSHPARDLQDTFWLTNGLLPRTHTSAMQVRTMEKMTPPFKVAVPGWVYRQ
jgi:phenylalanyl-tRNA synthetase alpha chain